MSLIEALPSFTGSATYEEFRRAYDVVQCVCFHKDKDDVSITSQQKQQESLQVMFDTFNGATLKDQASWCIENDGGDSSLLPSHFLSPTTCAQSAYCSFVIQDDSNKSVTSFTEKYILHSTLPIAPTTTDGEKQRDSNIFVTSPYWMFIGRNTSTTPLMGRSEHTDSIQHNGTFHYQMAGCKTWTLRPTEELKLHCDELDVALLPSYIHTVQEGDVFFINTRLWWHQTCIPGVKDTQQQHSNSLGLSISFARDVYLDGLQPVDAADEYMSSIDGAFAKANIPNGTILLTELDELPPTMGRSKDREKANCEIVELLDSGSDDDDKCDGDSIEAQMVLVATRDIKEGDFLVMLEVTDL